MPAATLFVDQNFSGAYADLEEGDYNVTKPAARDSVGNDTVSSLRVKSGYTVTAYTDADFGGDSKTFTADTPYVGDAFNDKISSVRVSASAKRRVPGPPVPDSIVFVQPPPVI